MKENLSIHVCSASGPFLKVNFKKKVLAALAKFMVNPIRFWDVCLFLLGKKCSEISASYKDLYYKTSMQIRELPPGESMQVWDVGPLHPHRWSVSRPGVGRGSPPTDSRETVTASLRAKASAVAVPETLTVTLHSSLSLSLFTLRRFALEITLGSDSSLSLSLFTLRSQRHSWSGSLLL